MKIFGLLGPVELVIIVVIIAVLCGPSLFKKLGGRTKDLGKAAKKGLETGATEAGVDVDKIKEDNKGKSPLDVLGEFQDKVDEKMESRKELDIED